MTHLKVLKVHIFHRRGEPALSEVERAYRGLQNNRPLPEDRQFSHGGGSYPIRVPPWEGHLLDVIIGSR